MQVQRFNFKFSSFLESTPPFFEKKDYVKPNQVDECVQGFVDCTISEYYLWGCCNMPLAWEWYVNETDSIEQYEHFKRSMSVPFVRNQVKKTCSAVVLKSPHHSVKLKTILNVYDSPTFVWLHRDLEDVVGSTCSMNITVQECVNMSYEDKKIIGKRTLHSLANAMNKAVKDRIEMENNNNNNVQFIDIFQPELRNDPLKAINKVYSALNINVSNDFIEKLKNDTIERKKKRKTMNNKNHKYSISEFGLSLEDINNAFHTYNEMVQRFSEI
jgi:hypothetical protein